MDEAKDGCAAALEAAVRMGTVEALRRLAVRRDDAAWSAILFIHGPGILRLAGRMGGAAFADDVCQESLLQIRDHAGQFSPPSGTVDAEGAARRWIMCVAYRTALKMVLANTVRERHEVASGVPDKAPEPAPDEVVLLQEQAEAVRREVAALPDALRSAVCMRYYGGFSYADVSAAFACSEETARKRVERGVTELRTRLASAGMAVGVAALLQVLGESAEAAAGAGGIGMAEVATLERLASWQPLLHSSQSASLTGVISIGGIIIMKKVIVVVAVLLFLLMQGALMWHTKVLSDQVSDLRANGVLNAELAGKIKTLEAQVLATRNDASALKTNSLAQFGELARMQEKAKDTDTALALVFPRCLNAAVARNVPLNQAMNCTKCHGDKTPKSSPARGDPQAPFEVTGAGKLDNEKIRKLLLRKVSIEFNEAPFADVVAFISESIRAPIITDPKIGLNNPPKVTMKIQDTQLDAVLVFALKLAGLEYTIQGHAIFIHRPNGAEKPGPGTAVKPPAPPEF